MLASLLVFMIYASFVLDLVIWPIPSEASSKALWSSRSRGFKGRRRFFQWMAAVLSLIFVLSPLVLALIQWQEPMYFSWLWTSGLILSITGRILSLLGTRALRSHHGKYLVKKNIFRWTRNPISLGIDLTFLGLVVCFGNWWLWLGYAWFLGYMHSKILMEERHLLSKYGEAYQIYELQTPRYLIF